MKMIAVLFRSGVLCAAVLFASRGEIKAQAPTEPAPVKSSNPEDLSQAELLKSYLQVRELLHATQLAIATNRAETEANGRAQAAAITEKLESIKSAMEAERQRQQVETLRANAERERQQMDAQRSNRTVLWVSVGFGALGLIAMLLMPLVQWRTISRIAEVTQRPIAAPSSMALMAGDPEALPGPSVTLSNQRLMAVMEKMEKRILELEHTAVQPIAVATTPVLKTNGSEPATTPPAAPISEQAARISALLGKGKFFLSTNKPKDAVVCYDEILGLEANHAEALVKKGAALEKLKQDDAALKCYDRAIQANQKMTLAYLSKAGVCNRLGRYDEAMECYEQALQTAENGK
jgi:tetratricopeptide (TPR) repeat protein